MLILIKILLSTIAVFVTARILPGVHVTDFGHALVIAVVLGVINAFIRPILLILTLPINILTLGLFTFVVMGLCVMLATLIVPGFVVDGFFWAMAFAFVFAVFNFFLEKMVV